MNKFHTIQIYNEGDHFIVKGHGEYERHSVNYGMTRIVFLDCFDTLEEAKKAYPKAVEGGSKFLDNNANSLPSVAPSWFDPYAAGERWDDDY